MASGETPADERLDMARITTTRQATRLRLMIYRRDGWRIAPNGDGTFRVISPAEVKRWGK